jgi:hypothetical protein
MSKLKITISLVSITLIAAVAFVWQKNATTVKADKFSHLFSEETRLWGKASGPVQVRIEFKEQTENQVKLVGQVRSTLPEFELNWKLPKGVRVVSGVVSETIQQPANSQLVHNREITVEVDWPLKNPHLVLRAAENSEEDAFGASTVFNLDPSLEDLEKQEIIRAHMKSRQIQKLVK